MEQPQHSLRVIAANSAKSPTRKAVQVGLVVLLHLGLFLGLTAGLAKKMMDKLPEPIVVDVTQEKLPDEAPPPPPPETVKPPPPPTIPPPDINIAADMLPPATNAIPAQVARPAPPSNPMEGVTAPASVRSVSCSNEFYPALSARMRETGTNVISFIIQADGNIRDLKVKTSSGKPRLDDAALNCYKGRKYNPAKKDGVPIEIPWEVKITWALN